MKKACVRCYSVAHVKNDISVDGQMVDDIAAGKTGTVVLEFNSQWLDDSIGQEFPKFEDNKEITL